MIALRPLLPLAAVAACCGAVDDGVAPLPPLPPQPRPMQVEPGPAPRTPEARLLGDDLRALRNAVERVDAVLAAKEPAAEAPGAVAPTAPAPAGAVRTALPPRRSTRLGLSVQAWTDGSATITADVERQRLEAVYRELAALLERPIDDALLTTSQKLVTLKVKDLPWDEALDRLFGQAGIAWREEGAGAAAKIVVVDADRAGDDARRDARAVRALERAAADRSSPLACEAMFRLAAREAAAGRHLAAIRGWARLVSDFDQRKEPAVRRLVMDAIRGIAASMAASEQWLEALGVYRNWLARAGEGEPGAPEIMLAAAEAALRAAERHGDPNLRDDAGTLLEGLLTKHGDDPVSAAPAARARLLLGELLFAQRRWAAAERHLAEYVRAAGDEQPRIAWWLAECAYRQGRWEEARPRFERLARAEIPGIARSERAQAALRIGQCWMEQDPPQYARALFAFLRARQEFSAEPLAAETVVAIARCYAELEHEEGAIEQFWALLKDERIEREAGRDRLDQLLGGIQTSLGQYEGPVRARVLFYIAQADYRQAWRNRKDRAALVAAAIQRYDRVLKENPPTALRHAAQLGLARVAFLGGDSELGVHNLTDLLKDPAAAPRDRAFAARELGDHLRDAGRLREAIEAYQGRVP